MARRRASGPKVRSGCLTCKFRYLKCNEEKPTCARCRLAGRTCVYGTPKSTSLVNTPSPRPLAPAPAVDSTTEQALEIFFLRTAPQLGGKFEQSFFGSVLQLSLSEPAIREAICALGILHDQTAVAKLDYSPDLPVKLYNRSIRAVLEKVAGDADNIQLVATVNILFVCFEYFQGNLDAAASHIRGGLNLFKSWRQFSRKEPQLPWGRSYFSPESNFMEKEIASILSLLTINAIQWGSNIHSNLLLNPVDQGGNIILPDSFESLGEARAGLLDLISFGTWQSQQFDAGANRADSDNSGASTIHDQLKNKLSAWNSRFDDLIDRQGKRWTHMEKRAADSVIIMRRGFEFGIETYESEGKVLDWETNRAAYSDVITRLDNLVSEANRFSDELSNAFSLEFGMVFPLHAVAWRSPLPYLHRRGLDLRTRIADMESLENKQRYVSISSRLMEIEGAYIDSPPDLARKKNCPPPRHVRISDFSVAGARQQCQEHPPAFAVTFWSRPDGPDGPWYSMTEDIHLGPARAVKIAPNLETKDSEETYVVL